MTEDENNPEPAPRYRALVGLVLVVVLAVAVLFIMHRLQESAQMQDCLASGRTNCAPISGTDK